MYINVLFVTSSSNSKAKMESWRLNLDVEKNPHGRNHWWLNVPALWCLHFHSVQKELARFWLDPAVRPLPLVFAVPGPVFYELERNAQQRDRQCHLSLSARSSPQNRWTLRYCYDCSNLHDIYFLGGRVQRRLDVMSWTFKPFYVTKPCHDAFSRSCCIIYCIIYIYIHVLLWIHYIVNIPDSLIIILCDIYIYNYIYNMFHFCL